eukprot:3847738-Prymnesium_polylepis.1
MSGAARPRPPRKTWHARGVGAWCMYMDMDIVMADAPCSKSDKLLPKVGVKCGEFVAPPFIPNVVVALGVGELAAPSPPNSFFPLARIASIKDRVGNAGRELRALTELSPSMPTVYLTWTTQGAKIRPKRPQARWNGPVPPLRFVRATSARWRF